MEETLRFVANGSLLAADGGASLKYFDMQTGGLVHAFDDMLSVERSSASNSRLLARREKKQIIVEDFSGKQLAIDAKTGASTSVLTFPKGSIPRFFSVSNNRFAFASRALPIVVDLYETTSWKRLRQYRFTGAEEFHISAIALTPDGQYFAVSGDQNYRAVHW